MSGVKQQLTCGNNITKCTATLSALLRGQSLKEHGLMPAGILLLSHFNASAKF